MYKERIIHALSRKDEITQTWIGRRIDDREPRGRKGTQSPLVLLAAKAWSRVDLRRARMNIEIGTGSPETNGRAIRENGPHTVPVNRNSTICFDKDYHRRGKPHDRA